jgi:hypothetical protein
LLLCQASHFAKEGQELCLGDEPFLVSVETREKLHQSIFWAFGVCIKTSCARHVLEFLQGEHMIAVLVQTPEKLYRLRIARRGAFHLQRHPRPINWYCDKYREIFKIQFFPGRGGEILYAPKLLGAFALRSV